MSSSKPSNLSFWSFSAAVLALSAGAALLVMPALNSVRHQEERNLVEQGSRSSGETAAAWYRLAQTVAPHDPAPAVALARQEWAAGAHSAAAASLARYKAPQAAVLRGEYLVQLERYDEAEAILGPLEGYVGGSDLDANHWLGTALAEQGKLRAALDVFGAHPVGMQLEPNEPYVLLQQELGIGPVNPRFPNPEVAAGEYAKLGMIRSAQRVLAQNHVASASSWLLRAKLDQALIQVNWQEVENDYQQALAADPTSSAAVSGLQLAVTHTGDQKALQMIDDLQQHLPAR